MAAFEHVSSVCTLAVLPRGALAGAASRGSGEHQKRLAVRRTNWLVLLGCLAAGGLVSSGESATRGPPQGWEVCLTFGGSDVAGPGKEGDG